MTTTIDTELQEQVDDMLEEHSTAFADYLDDQGEGHADWAIESFEDAYCGKYDTLKAYAEEIAHECFEVPANFMYFDYASLATDLDCEGYWISGNGHVFRPV